MKWVSEKIIRDNIWVKIIQSNEQWSIRLVKNTSEKIAFLMEKFTEELIEFNEAHSQYIWESNRVNKKLAIREAGDVLEVLDTLIASHIDDVDKQIRGEFIEMLKQGEYTAYDIAEIVSEQQKKKEELWWFIIWYILKI